MDVAGPAQVFVNAADIGARYDVGYVSERPTTASHQGLGLSAPSQWPDLDPRDLVLVPGWRTRTDRTAAEPFSRRMLTRICEHWDNGGHLASVCAGSLALAHAGVLAGRAATTHHDLIGELARYPGVRSSAGRPVHVRAQAAHLGGNRQRHRPGPAPRCARPRSRARRPGGPCARRARLAPRVRLAAHGDVRPPRPYGRPGPPRAGHPRRPRPAAADAPGPGTAPVGERQDPGAPLRQRHRHDAAGLRQGRARRAGGVASRAGGDVGGVRPRGGLRRRQVVAVPRAVRILPAACPPFLRRRPPPCCT